MFAPTRPAGSYPATTARIVDEDGGDLPDGEIGTLLVKGDSTCAY